MNTLRIALGATLLMTGAAASAQSASDARCILLSNAFAQQAKTGDAQKLAEASFYFYLGRISANATAAQIKTLFDQQAKSVTDATAGGIMDSCAKEFKAKVDLVESLGSKPQPATTPKK
ncbi:MAG TPA: hypothetical protein VFW39_12480 [Sphingomicrobium sp.]|nr:hypothetical protein [Sphingomicrobium sp.]